MQSLLTNGAIRKWGFRKGDIWSAAYMMSTFATTRNQTQQGEDIPSGKDIAQANKQSCEVQSKTREQKWKKALSLNISPITHISCGTLNKLFNLSN